LLLICFIFYIFLNQADKLCSFLNKSAKRQQNKSKHAAKKQQKGSKAQEPNRRENTTKIFIPAAQD